MRSRMDRYRDYDDNNQTVQRSRKNQELYETIGTNAKYTNFTDVSNSNTYLLNPSKKSNYTRENYQQLKEYTNITPTTRTRKELDDFNHLYQKEENKIYDINSFLEKAKEQRKDKDALEEKRKLKNTNYNILASINPEELEEYRKEKMKRIAPEEDGLKELINTIASKTLAGEISKETGVDLLSDLMATSAFDRIPSENKNEKDKDLELSKEILDKDALKEIDKVKEEDKTSKNNSTNLKDMDDSFYTKSMDLSDKDFFTDDEEEEKKIPVGIKILLVLVLIVLIGVSIYFIYQSV